MKIMTIVGARPQFVKEAALQAEFKKHDDIEEILVHTGQHYDANMSDVFFSKLNIDNPKYNLNINSSNHGEMTGKMMIELEKLMCEEQPDKVMLYGDTNSTVAGALVANKLRIQTIHIEAGNRVKKPYMPEEANRIVTDHLSDMLFCESHNDIKNLRHEGIENNVFFSGDVMYDIFLKMEDAFEYDLQKKFALKTNEYIVMTLHRDFNVDSKDTLASILQNIDEISKEIPVIYPMHPRTKQRIKSFGLESFIKNIITIEPINYLELMGLAKNCFKGITDSGGFQKEIYYAGKQAVLLMPEPGAVELADVKWNLMSNGGDLKEQVYRKSYEGQAPTNIYGNGKAAKYIVEKIIELEA